MAKRWYIFPGFILAVNPFFGGHLYTGENARLYIVSNKTEAEWQDGAALLFTRTGTGIAWTSMVQDWAKNMIVPSQTLILLTQLLVYD